MSQVKRLLEKLGVESHDAARENLLIAELIELNLAITIDNHLKLKKIMAQIDDLIAQAAAENAVIGQLAGAVKSLADGYVALEDKYNALVLQGTSVTAITAEQFKTFGD